MKEQELRELVAARARSHIGLNEGDGSYRCIIDAYNAIEPLPRGYRLRYTDPWCAAFVSVVGQECGLGNILLPECSCPEMVQKYKAAGRYDDASLGVPHVGDIIMYSFSGHGAEHTGIIAAMDGDMLSVVEGNSGDSVRLRKVNANARSVYGFCAVDYASAAEAEPYRRPAQESQSAANAPEARVAALELPWLQRGDRGECVRALQGILIARGFRCGPEGADGEFGAGTHGGLVRYQRARGLEQDGIAGDESWHSLLGA